MEWRDLPPGHAIPQAAADGGGQCRALVMGKVPGWRWRGMEGHKTATLRYNWRWMKRPTGDRLNHPRYRDFAMIPAAAFLQ
jgi:hypothetical protein